MNLLEALRKFIDLQEGEDQKERVLENVKSQVSFRGANLWIWACAIVVASVGLNVNSTAVIIGAMLISPLMGPIVGAGFALGTYNFSLLQKSMKNLFIATVVSLLVSTLFFWISPFKEAQSELLARTSPNFYDILIAFFGGLVGVIAITRVEKGNPIPGVAIATALMPPLCTAGYGIATGQLTYFLGAFYLYSINCFFICIATYLIVKYLQYPALESKDATFDRKIRNVISALVVVMTLPSFYLAYTLWTEKKFMYNVERYISREFTQKGYTVIHKNIRYQTNNSQIQLAFLNKTFSDHEINQLKDQLATYDLGDAQLVIAQDLSDIKNEIMKELQLKGPESLSEKDVIINNLQKELRMFRWDKPELLGEIKLLFPSIQKVSIGNLYTRSSDSTYLETIFTYTGPRLTNAEEKKLQGWIQLKNQGKPVRITRGVDL